MSKVFAILLLLGALTTVATASARTADDLFWPEPVELPSHRLPTRVKPLHYALHLDFTRSYLHLATYEGAANITVQFEGPDNSKALRCFNKLTNHIFSAKSGRSKSKSFAGAKAEQCAPPEGRKNQIVMHADKSISIESIRVFRFVGAPDEGKLKQLKIAKRGRDEEKQLIVLNMAAELPLAGSRGLIEVIFETRTRYDNHGIYRSASSNKGRDYIQVAAKFQPTFARLALPCFDEPAFKARFTLSLAHSPIFRAHANMELAKQEVLGAQKVLSRFKQSPPMSIHMLAFTLGEYDEPLELQVRDNLRLRALTPPGKRASAAFALEVAKFAIEWFEKYIDFKYPLEKLDIVAFPDTDTDNTETWGLVFVRDILALVDDETKPDSRITTAVNVAHVVVHQWFANLITARWWDDMWITESVASQMAFEIVAEFWPELGDLSPEQSEYFVRISTLSNVMNSDSSGKNHSLSPAEFELTSSDQVYELFDNIQFMKSASLAHLVRDTVGRDEWRQVLRELVRANAYGNVHLRDLLGAISKLPSAAFGPMEGIIRSWAILRSYPIVNVAYLKSEHKLVLYEEARHIAKSRLDHLNRPWSPWTLPLEVLISDAKGAHQTVKRVVLGAGLNEPTAGRVELPAWFVVGLDYVKLSPKPSLSTYYRVRYSDNLLRGLKTPIERRQLTTMDRVHLLDDSRALAAGGLLSPDIFKELLSWHAGETEPAMIIEILLATQTLGTLTTTGSSPSPASQVFMDLYRRNGFSVRGDEPLLEQRARMVTLRALVEQGVPEVIAAGVKAYEESEGEVALFLREPVYAAVVIGGTSAQVRQLAERLRRTESHEEQLRLASALALSKDPEVLTQTGLFLIVSDIKEREQKPVRDALLEARIKINQSLQEGRIRHSDQGN